MREIVLAVAVLVLFGVFTGSRAQTCSQVLTSPTGELYNISALIGQVARWTGQSGDSVNVSLCENTLGLCYQSQPSGFCLYHFAGGHNDFIGNFGTATALPGGAGVTLNYPYGTGGNSGRVVLNCVPGAGNISNVQVTVNVGSVTTMTIDSSAACPFFTPPNPCSVLVNSTTDDSYNISALIGTVLKGVNDTTGDNFTVTICTNLAGTCDSSLTSGFCTYHLSGGHEHYCGSFTNGITALPYGEGVQLAYTGGFGGNSGRVVLNCDPSAGNLSNIRFQPEVGGLNIIYIESALACPTNRLPNPCLIPINSSSGEIYEISSLFGTLLKGENTTSGDNFTISLCTNTAGRCSGFNTSGFCKNHEGHQDLIGIFDNATGLPDGQGVNLTYVGGQDSNYGQIILSCAFNVSTIKFISFNESVGGLNTVYATSRYACPLDTNPCDFPLTSSTGDVYDIGALAGNVIGFKNQTTGDNFTFSICANTVTLCGVGRPIGICEYHSSHFDAIGSFDSSPIALPFGQGVSLSYPSGDGGNKGAVVLLCSPGAPAIGNIQVNNNIGALTTVTIESGLACPSGTPVPPSPPTNQCRTPLVSATGDIYNISSVIGFLIQATSVTDSAVFNVSLCTDTIFCNGTTPGLRGVCREATSTFDYNAGRFQSAVGRAFSEGVDLLYQEPDYTTYVKILCDPTVVKRFQMKTVVSAGASTNITFASSYACPVNRTDAPPPTPTAKDHNKSNSPAPAKLPDYVLGLIIAAVVLLTIAVIILVVILIKISKRSGYAPLKGDGK